MSRSDPQALIDTVGVAFVADALEAFAREPLIGNVVETLLSRALRIAGADRAVLLRESGDGLRMEATARASPEGSKVEMLALPAEASDAHDPLVHRVLDSGGVAMPDDAERRGRVLCMAVPTRDGARRALLLDRSRATPAWSRRCIAELLCLAHLGAAGIGNADRFRTLQESQQRPASAGSEATLLGGQRLEVTSTLARGIAHDFNNILATILGYGEMALRDVPEGTRLRRDIDNIMVAGERGRALVARILEFSRTGETRKETTRIDAIVREAVDMLSATLPAGIHLDTDLGSGEHVVAGDATLVHQVFMSLATNAIQAMPSGGLLQVILHTAELRQSMPMATGSIGPGEFVVLSVTDTGTGIAPDVVHRIFDPFFTTRDVGEGTGLGLSAVHGIVSDMCGAIEVQTELDAGTAMTVYFPIGRSAHEVATAPARTAPRGKHQQILIVDDEAMLVTLISEMLADLGYVPVGFSSSRDALAAFRAHPDRFEMLITDERMPEMTGSALVREIRSRRTDIPVLLLTGCLEDSDIGNGRESVNTEALLKPVSMDDLGLTVARLLGTSAPSRGSKSILVVDDDPSIVASLEHLLQHEGYRVRAARDGRKALDAMQNAAPDLVLLDVMLPSLSGLEVCRRIRENPAWAQVRVVMLTASASADDVRRALARGADGYVTKPFSNAELLRQIRMRCPVGASA